MRDSIRQPRIFFGWWIVVSCFLNGVILGGFVSMGFTAFIEPIVAELGWSYTEISIAVSLRGVEVALFAPVIGFIVDRWGPRRVMLIGIIFIGVALMFLSTVHSLGMFYVGFIIMAIGVGGNSPTVVMTAMANWFRKKLGLATGIIGSGFACGGLLIPLVVKLIDTFDWRMALVIVGIATLVIGIPMALILRHKPEQYGYLPDGDIIANPAAEKVITGTAPSQPVDFGTKQALRSRAFWYLTLAMTFQVMATNAVMVHVMPAVSSVNISRATGSLIATGVPLLSIAGRLGSGWMGDRFRIKGVSIGFFGVLMMGLLFMSFLSSTALWMAFPFIIFFGIGWGGNNTLRVNLTNQYFGRNRFGSIFGIMMGINAVGGIMGPIFAGWIYDNYAGYRIAWLTLAALVFISIIAISLLPPRGTDAPSLNQS